MRNTLTRWLLTVALITLTFTGGAQAQTTLTLFSHPTLPLTDEIIRGFEQENPGVTVEQVLNMSGNMRSEGLLLAIASGTAPDLAYTHLDFVPIFTYRGLLLDLDPYIQDGSISAQSIRDYFPGVLEQAEIDGKHHFLPLRQSMNVYIYNTAMFAQAGLDPTSPPDTWESLADAAQRLTRQGSDGVVEQWGITHTTSAGTTNTNFNPYLWQAGGEFFTPDGRSVAFNSDEGVEALEFFVSLFERGWATPEQTGPFMEGRAAILAWAAQSYMTQAVRGELAGSVDVGPTLTHTKRSGFGSLAGYVIPKDAPNRELAVKFLDYLLRPEVARLYLAEYGFIPTRRGISLDYFGDDEWWVRKFVDEAPHIHYDIAHPFVRDLMGTVGQAVMSAIQGEQPARQALDEAARQANAYLQEQMTR